MPTGYTAAVQSGKITEFNDFAMQCARAFGALVMMRDEPSSAAIPERLEPSTKYHDDAISTAEARLAELAAMGPLHVREAALQAHAIAYSEWDRSQQERKAQKARYEAMLSKVDAWKPPTPEHHDMKKFMRDQLTDSIQFDCGTSPGFDDKPKTLEPAAWVVQQVEKAQRDLAYHRKARAEEIRRTESRNEWLTALRASLNGSRT